MHKPRKCTLRPVLRREHRKGHSRKRNLPSYLAVFLVRFFSSFDLRPDVTVESVAMRDADERAHLISLVARFLETPRTPAERSGVANGVVIVIRCALMSSSVWQLLSRFAIDLNGWTESRPCPSISNRHVSTRQVEKSRTDPEMTEVGLTGQIILALAGPVLVCPFPTHPRRSPTPEQLCRSVFHVDLRCSHTLPRISDP